MIGSSQYFSLLMSGHWVCLVGVTSKVRVLAERKKISFDWGKSVTTMQMIDCWWLWMWTLRWTRNGKCSYCVHWGLLCLQRRTNEHITGDEWITRRKPDKDFPSNNNRKCVQFSNIITAIKLILVHVIAIRSVARSVRLSDHWMSRRSNRLQVHVMLLLLTVAAGE